MSYNNYGNYSPYFPSQPADPNDRNQYSYQNTAGSTSNNPPHGEYQRQAYVAPNAALSSQQHHPHQSSNGAYADTMRYSNLEGTANTNHQNQRNDYGYGNARTPGDTTALGNLAYASTLRQTSGPIQRPADYSRQGQNGGYDQGQNQIDGHGIQRTDSRGSRGSSNLNSPYTSAQSYSTYPATSGQQNQGVSLHNANYGSYQPAHQHPQPVRQEAGDARRSSQHTVPAPPSRPASGQSTHAPCPQSNQQSKQRSRTAVHTPVQQSSGPKPAQAVKWISHQPNASSDEAQLNRQLNSQQTRPGAVTTAPPNRASVSSTSHIQGPPNLSTHERLASRPSAQLPPIQNVLSTQSGPRTDAVQNQHPTTVDPNQVFNHYEYEKRQAEAEASKRKAAAEAEVKRKAQAVKQVQQIALANANMNGVSANGIDEEARKKEQMETEMKLMLEKMREYKSKDPTLFSQIWESVKKAQPPGAKDTTQASELPASKEVALPSPQVAPSNLQSPQNLQSPDEPAGPPNALERFPLPQNEDLPDRGKFPAARRKRYEKRSRTGRVSAANEQADGEVLAVYGQADAEPRNAMSSVAHTPNVASNISTVVAPNATTLHPNSHPQTDHTPDHATSSTQPAQQVSASRKKAEPKKARSTPSTKHPVSGVAASSVAVPSDRPILVSPVPTPDAQKSILPTASGHTVWPEADKWTLANAARDTLMTNPGNHGKLITNTEVHNILNQGPTYEELCSILEAKGFVVERTPFAQRLLAAVPMLKKSHPPKPAQEPSTPRPPHPPPSQSLQSSQPSQATANGFRNVAPTAPMFGMLQPVVGATPTQTSQAPHQTPKSESRPVMQRPVRPPAPPSKQQQARKRSFGEIVDLTAEMSSDEDLKRRRAEELKKIEEIKHMQQVKAAMEAAMNSKANANATHKEPNDPTWRSKAIRLSPGTGLSTSEDDAVSRLSRFKNPTPQREHLRRSKEVVRPMNARADALRRSTYDPKTIARDILVTAGKHPTMASLNYHLDCLRSSFRHVDAGSDLSTFNWDLIDPGGPPVKPREVETPVAQQNENEDADDEEVDGAIATARRSPQSAQHRQSRLATTTLQNNAEDVTMLDTTPSGPIKGVFQPGRGRGRRRGSQPSRGGHSRASLGRPPRQPDHNNPPAQIPHKTADVSMLGPGMATSSAFEPRVLPSTPTQASMTPTKVQLSTGDSGDPGKKRRGRPPKNRMLGTSDFSPQHSIPSRSLPDIAKDGQESVVSHESSSHAVPARIAQPLNTPRIVGSANSQRPTASTTPARPSGLRNQINTSPFAVVIPRSPGNVEPAPSYRKAKKPKVSPAPTPKYQVYKCRWKSCEGQLHNLETLRKHVQGHMSQSDEDFECLWEGCGTTKVAGTSGSERQPLTFKSETAWERHMDGRHLDHYAWELGDGPSPHPSGESPDAGRKDML